MTSPRFLVDSNSSELKLCRENSHFALIYLPCNYGEPVELDPEKFDAPGKRRRAIRS